MALTRQQSLIWKAMNVGVQWVLRDGDDPLAPQKRPAAAASATAPSATLPASSAPAAAPSGAFVRRGPMATRLRRQQAAAAAASQAAPAPTPAPAAPAAARGNPLPSLKPTLKPALKPVAAAPVRPVHPLRAGVPTEAPVQADPQLAAEVANARWEDIKGIVDRCKVCSMAHERTHTVVADGAPGCPIVMVGEAPGREEDLSGIPFVGNSGKLLTAILEACDLKRGRDVAICNVLKCRPPGNRDPRPDEVAACAAFLDRQLELLQPRLLILMGKHAVKRILGEERSISKLRGQLFETVIASRRVSVVVTYHPSYLLRNPVAKELGWHDILFAKKNLPQN